MVFSLYINKFVKHLMGERVSDPAEVLAVLWGNSGQGLKLKKMEECKCPLTGDTNPEISYFSQFGGKRFNLFFSIPNISV